ncbi:zinc carboxypeptidase [Cupriavidus necator N-1]|uniref:Zinc carboxypeptidase n=1 Tax=Cupriavidus necator (strain ATCC 43291 / DSM 13513 / CCUG 52238 / LMG 8453 / N-1) TaxID=1042878 RepID=F8GM71_CUPNN|nr:M14 family zinc carboxypeptidase [Cupriavidus necator]AEI80090.1 zinc carboxypeptidase [Cupriavidus necator N-1]MDX6010278.1 M14 family zinc carboxypeptidase [Cupriavidus necator]
MHPHAGFPEYDQLLALLDTGSHVLDTRVVCETMVQGRRFGVHAATLGSRDPGAPAIGIFGGIHGLERIGTQLVLDYLRSVLSRLAWDELLHRELQSVRLVFMPIVNPGGMWAGTRANPNGVDLMRNGPQDADARVPFLAGGQRIGAWLPWYRGTAGAPMEAESRALLRVVQEELLPRPLSFAVDCHSGYGWRDSIWFPYAGTRRPMAHLPEMYLLKTLFEQAHPHHGYTFEPQSHQYLLHGDLWDHAYDLTPHGNLFLPMTLELGSWLWIKKNPRQLFSREGIFNPIKAHRTARVLRRHVSLFDFLGRVAFAPDRWLPRGAQRDDLLLQARAHWQTEAPP